MKNITPLLLLCLIFISCKPDQETSESTLPEPKSQLTEEASWQKYFDENDVHGCFLLYEEKAKTWAAYNPARIDSGYLPASTFKVFNTMIVLDAGVIADTETKLPWDGRERFVKKWNQDLNLREAMQYSAAWFYQILVDSMGEETFQHYLDTLDYGNRSIGGPANMSWLIGGLRISAKEQIDLLVKLSNNDLPFSQRSMDIVKEIIPQEKRDDYLFRYKTGWAGRQEQEIGWLIGWVEKENENYFSPSILISTKMKMSKPE